MGTIAIVGGGIRTLTTAILPAEEENAITTPCTRPRK
jgi:hypothetical protein